LEALVMLGNRIKRSIAVVLLGSVFLGFGSCLNLDRVIRFGAFYGAAVFLFDNPAVFDVFPDTVGSVN